MDQLLGRGVAVDSCQRRVGGEVVPVHRGLEDADRGVLHQVAVIVLRVLQRLQHALVFGLVFDKTFDHRLPGFVQHADAAFVYPLGLPQAGDDAIVHRETLPGGDGTFDFLAHSLPVFRVGDLFVGDAAVDDQVFRRIPGQVRAAPG